MAIVNRQPDINSSGSRRASDRYRLSLALDGRDGAGGSLDIVVEDLSSGGFSFQLGRNLAIGDQIIVNLPDSTQIAARIVWQTSDRSGCEFERRLSRAELAVARLKAEPKLSETSDKGSRSIAGEQRYSRRVRAIIWILGAVLPWVLAYVAFANRP